MDYALSAPKVDSVGSELVHLVKKLLITSAALVIPWSVVRSGMELQDRRNFIAVQTLLNSLWINLCDNYGVVVRAAKVMKGDT